MAKNQTLPTASVESEDAPVYAAPIAKPARYSTPLFESDDDVLLYAEVILRNRLREPGRALSSPADSQAYLRLKLATLEHEEFALLYLDNRNRVLAFESLFRGTIDGASVHPREVVKAVLAHNATAVILAHNHPSGVPDPSRADRKITDRLRDALALIDVRVLDHIIVGGEGAYSFAEHGLI